jgi:hypothetical protein
MPRYLKSCGLALAAGVAVIIGRDVLAFGALSSWSMVLLGIPSSIAVLLPLALLASGVSVGADESRAGSRDAPVMVVAGVVAFGVAAFLAPWLGKAIAAGTSDPESGLAFQTIIGWRAEYQRLITAATMGRPGLPWMIPAAGLNYYQPIVAGLLGMLMTGVGLQVGRVTRDDVAPAVRVWMLAVLVIGSTVGLMNLAVSLAIEYGIAPSLALLSETVPSALVLFTLYWMKRGAPKLSGSSAAYSRAA